MLKEFQIIKSLIDEYGYDRMETFFDDRSSNVPIYGVHVDTLNEVKAITDKYSNILPIAVSGESDGDYFVGIRINYCSAVFDLIKKLALMETNNE